MLAELPSPAPLTLKLALFDPCLRTSSLAQSRYPFVYDQILINIFLRRILYWRLFSLPARIISTWKMNFFKKEKAFMTSRQCRRDDSNENCFAQTDGSLSLSHAG